MLNLPNAEPTSPAGLHLAPRSQDPVLTAAYVAGPAHQPERLRDAVRLLAIWAVRAAREEMPPADPARPLLAP